MCSIYVQIWSAFPRNKTVILTGSQRVEAASELFNAPVQVSDQSVLRGMLDLGNMSCTNFVMGIHLVSGVAYLHVSVHHLSHM